MNSGDSVRLVFVHIIRIIANHAFTILLLTVALGVLINVISEKFFRRPEAPPVVSHWLPFLGNTISYGKDPYKFLFGCQKKYGDVFTFVLLGRKQTVYLGTKGNDFILNARHKDVSAEEVYSPLTTPVFGDGVVYDVSSEKFFEQKKFIKFGLKPDALRSYIPLIQNEVEAFVETSPWFGGDKGAVQVTSMMAQLTIFTASRSLQGKEVRAALDESFANLYHDLDMGLTPINFLAPWAPLPHNRKRDRAHKKMATVYMNIIRTRRERANSETNDCVDEQDMINNLMSSRYKDGTPLSDKEIAHMMIALLMAGQHNSASIGSWILLRLASQPAIAEELYVEQVRVMGTGTKSSLSHADLQNLPLHSQVIRETLRIHSPIHSVMRKVKSPLPVEGTPYIIPTSHYLLASPGVSAQSEEYFPYPLSWNPHRWDLSSGNETISKGASSPYLPFGAGRHRCIGEQFAYVQLMVITATMVRHLKFRNVHGREGVVQTDYSSLFSRPQGPAIIQWQRRDHS